MREKLKRFLRWLRNKMDPPETDEEWWNRQI